jgi:hypothetical protein
MEGETGMTDIPITTYSLYFYGDSELIRGNPVKRVGVQGEGKIVAASRNRETIVIAWKGYGENPGSRYSGLYSYYPATTEVFVLDHVDEHGRKRYRSLIEWQTRKPKS